MRSTDICSIQGCENLAEYESAYGQEWMLCQDHADVWDLTPMTIPEFVTRENVVRRCCIWPGL